MDKGVDSIGAETRVRMRAAEVCKTPHYDPFAFGLNNLLDRISALGNDRALLIAVKAFKLCARAISHFFTVSL
jgi:hypothetical protein